jgi:hypothetical protein
MQGARVSLGRRIGGAIIILVVVAIIYGVLAAVGIAWLPSSVAAIAASSSVGQGPRLVSGYYVSQPFTSLGNGLPPYVLASATAEGSASIHVKPTLADVRAGKVAVIVETTTGDGSKWSPDEVHTISSWQTFIAALAGAAVFFVVIAFWLGGLLPFVLVRR